jgi:tetratricopeptide (TPR) repeat protein
MASWAARLMASTGTPEAPEAGVVDIPVAASTADDSAWKPVEDARGSSRMAAALQTWLSAHPHGLQAARGLYEEGLLQDNLLEAAGTFRRACGEGPASLWGVKASLALAKLEYFQERPEAALMVLENAETWPRPEELEPDWLFWRGQCRLVLKGFERAKADFERLGASYPHYPQAEEARLGLAECDAALKEDDKALLGYEGIYKDPQAVFGAQALWGAAVLRQRQGQVDEAKRLFLRLRLQYPASFEAKAVPARLQDLAKVPVPTPVPSPKPSVRALGRFYVQVGAYAKMGSAVRLQKTLKRRRYPVLVQGRKQVVRTLYFVKVGPYRDLPAALAASHKLQKQDHLPTRVIQE